MNGTGLTRIMGIVLVTLGALCLGLAIAVGMGRATTSYPLPVMVVAGLAAILLGSWRLRRR
jgi:hypothetical protein